MSSETGWFIIEADWNGKKRHLLSPLEPQTFLTPAIRPESIAGELTAGPPLQPTNFEPNPAFMRFMQWVIGKHGPQCPTLARAGEEQQTGPLWVVDLRVPDLAATLPREDMLGYFEVQSGKLTRYVPSSQYALLTSKGLVKLDPWLQEKLVSELRTLTPQPPLA